MVWYPATLLPGASTLLPDVRQLRWHELYLQYTALIEGQLETFLKEEGVPVAAMLSAATSGAAWSKCPPWQYPSSAPAPPQGAPGGSEQLDAPKEGPAH